MNCHFFGMLTYLNFGARLNQQTMRTSHIKFNEILILTPLRRVYKITPSASEA